MELGLQRGVAQVVERALILGGSGLSGKVHPAIGGKLGPHVLPALDQFFVDRVELIVLRVDLLEPVPLHHACFEEGSGRIGVVLEKLGLSGAVPREAETTVERFLALDPRLLDERVKGLWNVKALIVALLDQALCRLPGALMELSGGRLELIHLGRAEAIARALVPVNLAIDRVEGKSQLFHLARPIDAWNALFALHAPGAQPDTEWPEEPKPPRPTLPITLRPCPLPPIQLGPPPQ